MSGGAFLIAIEYAVFEPLEMCKLATVCKQAEAIMTRAWRHIAPPSFSDDCSNLVCKDCLNKKKATRAWGRCTRCIQNIRLISATQAKKDFLLKASMLDLLEHKESQSMYNHSQIIRTYMWQEVVELALRIHKGPKALLARIQLQKQRREGPSKAQVTRKLAIEKHMRPGGALHAMQSQEAWAKCAAPYVANGSGGGVSGVIRAFRTYTHQQQRREELEAALQVHGLQLRKDSRLCNAFIEETKGCKTLEETIQTMREMDWLHKHTDYAERMREACRVIGRSMRAEYDLDWIPQPQYDELCAEYRERISQRLRQQLLPSSMQ